MSAPAASLAFLALRCAGCGAPTGDGGIYPVPLDAPGPGEACAAIGAVYCGPCCAAVAGLWPWRGLAEAKA